MNGETNAAGTRRQLFGRRKGPRLSARQSQLFETLLPQLALDLEPGRDPREYFSSVSVDEVWLEVGFGSGEHFLWQAERHPHVGHIGAEPYEAGVAKLLSKYSPFNQGLTHPTALPPSVATHCARATPLPQAVEERQGAELSSAHGESAGKAGGGGKSRANIRLYQGDARDIVAALPDASLGRVFVLFPDPWPKLRHHKRRFIQMETLDALARVTKPGAELRFASDDPGYVAWTLECVLAGPSFEWSAERALDWNSRPDDWPRTRYEAKSLHGPPAFLRMLRR